SFEINTKQEYRLHANVAMDTLARYWEFFNYVHVPPGQSDYVYGFGNNQANDELHVVVVDDKGWFSGDPGSVLEVYKQVSRAVNAKNHNNTTNYYKTVINTQSRYVWWVNDRSTALSANAAFVESATGTAPLNMPLYWGSDGLDEANVELGTLINGYSLYQSAEDVDIGLVMTGKGRGLPI